MSCVPACVKQLLKDVGIEVDEQELRDNSSYTDEFGTDFKSIVAVLSKHHPTKDFVAGVPDLPDLSDEQLTSSPP